MCLLLDINLTELSIRKCILFDFSRKICILLITNHLLA